ncbi:hypothetical protein EVAR_21852_1 [Eumeta japonica]|uniref:Uncharacterized protein n=1 Tax=Eumeta variegata TaxID=151549 RepID=A0A4C1V7E1_EUMVA|nr:hypothetical protein EVAR_21852_1 [Eumeta japonica]
MMHSVSAKLALAAVAKGQAAIAAASFTILANPSPGINYTVPVNTQPYAFMVARPRELSRAMLFMLPFATDVKSESRAGLESESRAGPESESRAGLKSESRAGQKSESRAEPRAELWLIALSIDRKYERINLILVTLAVPVEEIAVDNAITSSEAEIVCTESEIISRDPEIISTPLNVEISAEQVIVPVEQEALNQSQLSRTLLQQFLLLVVFCLHDQIPKMKKMQSHQEQLDVYPSSRQETSSTTYAISNGVRTVAEIEQRLDLEERRLEVDRKRISLKIGNYKKNFTAQLINICLVLCCMLRARAGGPPGGCGAQHVIVELIRIRSSYDSQFQMLRRHEGRTSLERC